MKRLISILMITMLIFTAMPLEAHAATIVKSWPEGSFGTNIGGTLDSDGVLTLTGYGPMKDIVLYGPLDSYKTAITAIVMDNRITTVGSKMFDSCTNLISATIPTSATIISSYAFNNCSKLASISIPDSVKTIGDFALSGCSLLKNVTIGNSLETIGTYAFSNSGITSVILPDSVTTIGNYGFFSCNSLTEVTLSESLAVWGSRVFSTCSNLANVTIPEGVTSIGTGAFYSCGKITNIEIPDTVTSIGNQAFYGAGLTNLYLPNSVSSIGREAFSYCQDLVNVTLPNSVTSIQDSTFLACSKLSSVNIPNTVTSIGVDSFRICSNLTSITIPASVTSIGSNAFNSTRKLVEIINYSQNVQTVGSNGFRTTATATRNAYGFSANANYKAAVIANGYVWHELTMVLSDETYKHLDMGVQITYDGPQWDEIGYNWESSYTNLTATIGFPNNVEVLDAYPLKSDKGTIFGFDDIYSSTNIPSGLKTEAGGEDGPSANKAYYKFYDNYTSTNQTASGTPTANGNKITFSYDAYFNTIQPLEVVEVGKLLKTISGIDNEIWKLFGGKDYVSNPAVKSAIDNALTQGRDGTAGTNKLYLVFCPTVIEYKKWVIAEEIGANLSLPAKANTNESYTAADISTIGAITTVDHAVLEKHNGDGIWKPVVNWPGTGVKGQNTGGSIPQISATPGIITYRLSVFSTTGQMAQDIKSIEILKANTAPWITSIKTSPLNVKEGDTYRIQVGVDDAEKDTLSLQTQVYRNGNLVYSHSQSNIDDTAGVYPGVTTGLAPDADPGSYHVVCTVNDGELSGSDSYDFIVAGSSVNADVTATSALKSGYGISATVHTESVNTTVSAVTATVPGGSPFHMVRTGGSGNDLTWQFPANTGKFAEQYNTKYHTVSRQVFVPVKWPDNSYYTITYRVYDEEGALRKTMTSQTYVNGNFYDDDFTVQSH